MILKDNVSSSPNSLISEFNDDKSVFLCLSLALWDVLIGLNTESVGLKFVDHSGNDGNPRDHRGMLTAVYGGFHFNFILPILQLSWRWFFLSAASTSLSVLRPTTALWVSKSVARWSLHTPHFAYRPPDSLQRSNELDWIEWSRLTSAIG